MIFVSHEKMYLPMNWREIKSFSQGCGALGGGVTLIVATYHSGGGELVVKSEVNSGVTIV